MRKVLTMIAILSVLLVTPIYSTCSIAATTKSAGSTHKAQTVIYTVTASSLNVRSGPGIKYKCIGSLKKGEKITVLAHSKDSKWYKVTYAGKVTGWVSSKYIKGTK